MNEKLNYKFLDDKKRNILLNANTSFDYVNFFLEANGIDNTDDYVNKDMLYDCMLLFNMKKAVKLFDKHVNKQSKIGVLVDSDFDGYSSASCIYKLCKVVKIEPIYFMHTGKQHGLYQDVVDWVKKNKLKLLIVPDAMCDNYYSEIIKKKCKCDLLVLDHHDTNEKNPYATVVNPNYVLDTKYPNKTLSGCAVTWKFVQAYEQVKGMGENFSNSLYDVVGMSIVSDIMSLKNIENRTIVKRSVRNIKNDFLVSLVESSSFSLGNKPLEASSYSWSLVPKVNAMIRIGDMEEKDIVFNALCGNYKEFDYKKRGSTDITKEDIYTRASRLCTNAHSRQTKIRDKDMKTAVDIIEKDNLNEHKILIVDTMGLTNSVLTGVTAIKVADKYKKPTLIVKRISKKIDESIVIDGELVVDDTENTKLVHNLISDSNMLLGGSGRNIDNCYVESLKDELVDTGLIEMAEGHQNACGVKLYADNIEKITQYFDEKYKDAEPMRYIIYDEMESQYLDIVFIDNVNQFVDKYVVNDIKSPLFLIKNVLVDLENVEVMGKNEDTFKFILNEDIEVVMFKCEEETNQLLHLKKEGFSGSCMIDIIGSVKMNEYNGNIIPQLEIKDYCITENNTIDEWNTSDDDENNQNLIDEWDSLWG